MAESSLFGHIAVLLHSHPENVATEALKYILETYASAIRSFRNAVSPTDIEIPETLHFQTQVNSLDDSRPDLVGHDVDGKHRLVIESKFWAGLTENQPVNYLRMLPKDEQSILVVIAPSARLETLWPKLLSRIEEAKLTITSIDDKKSEQRVLKLDGLKALVLTSWQSVLRQMIRGAEASGEPSLSADLLQLDGLCNRMDSEGFFPFTDDDLSPSVGKRVQQLSELVDTVVAALTTRYSASTKGLSTGGGQATYGRFFYWRNYGCFFFYSPELWVRSETPLFVAIQEGRPNVSWADSNALTKTMTRFAMLNKKSVVKTSKGLAYPFAPKLYEEKAEVISDLATKIVQLLEFCSSEST